MYIAIRRGLMKVPTTGTSVFTPRIRTGTGTTAIVTGVGFPPDMAIVRGRVPGRGSYFVDRLRGTSLNAPTSTTPQIDDTITVQEFLTMDQNGFTLGSSSEQGLLNFASETKVDWFFRRAAGFFDEVCYTGTGGSSRVLNHNLRVVPEMVIVKSRNFAYGWETLFNTGGTIYSFRSGAVPEGGLNQTAQSTTSSNLGGVSTTTFNPPFYFGETSTNTNGITHFALLFASCPGVSKVGSYTGNGTNQTINCGFTNGARFILIKRTNAASDWYVWDTARGIVAANDPRVFLNGTDNEVTTDDSVDPASSGFIVNQVAATNINVNGGNYVFLAIA
jgi:hypothetical protein